MKKPRRKKKPRFRVKHTPPYRFASAADARRSVAPTLGRILGTVIAHAKRTQQ